MQTILTEHNKKSMNKIKILHQYKNKQINKKLIGWLMEQYEQTSIPSTAMAM